MTEIQPVHRAVGARIQMIREAIGMTQGQLAKAVGYTRTSVTNIEAGRQRMPLHQVEEVARALNTTPKHLLKGVWF